MCGKLTVSYRMEKTMKALFCSRPGTYASLLCGVFGVGFQEDVPVVHHHDVVEKDKGRLGPRW